MNGVHTCTVYALFRCKRCRRSWDSCHGRLRPDGKILGEQCNGCKAIRGGRDWRLLRDHEKTQVGASVGPPAIQRLHVPEVGETSRRAEAVHGRAGNILVNNLDRTIDNKALYDMFILFGTIVSCKVACDSAGKSRGYGFVQYETEAAAKQATESVHGMQIGGNIVEVIKGKPLYVGLAEKTEQRQERLWRRCQPGQGGMGGMGGGPGLGGMGGMGGKGGKDGMGKGSKGAMGIGGGMGMGGGKGMGGAQGGMDGKGGMGMNPMRGGMGGGMGGGMSMNGPQMMGGMMGKGCEAPCLGEGRNRENNKVTQKLCKSYDFGIFEEFGKLRKSYGKVTKLHGNRPLGTISIQLCNFSVTFQTLQNCRNRIFYITFS